MNAKPPIVSGEADIDYYPLPGTSECESYEFCKKQFHNSASSCPTFQKKLDCSDMPYIVNASTPMGFWRHTLKMTEIDGQTPICQLGYRNAPTPTVWKQKQEPFTPIDSWWKLLGKVSFYRSSEQSQHASCNSRSGKFTNLGFCCRHRHLLDSRTAIRH